LIEEVVALHRIDLPWLDKPSDLGINSGRNPFELLFLTDAPGSTLTIFTRVLREKVL